MIGKALVSGLSIALSVVLVLMIAVTPLGYGVGERVDEAGIVIPVNYTVYYECPGGQDPFAGSYGFLTNAAGISRFVLGSSTGHNNFYSLSAGTILDKRYVIDGDSIVQMLYFYFTSTTTTAITIRSQIGGVTPPYDALYIPSRTYEAYRVYRYTLTFPKVTYVTDLGNVTLGLGWASTFLTGSTSVKAYNSGTEVPVSPTFSLQYANPAVGSTTWTVYFIISFNNVNDVGKTFNVLSLSSSCTSSECSTQWTNYEHVRIVLNQPFTIQDVGDRIVLAITFQLVPLS